MAEAVELTSEKTMKITVNNHKDKPKKPTVPNTSDNAHTVAWMITLLSSLMILLGAVVLRIRSN